MLSWPSLIQAAGQPESINLRQTVTVEVVKKTKDAVVNVSATKLVAQRVSPFGGDPFWSQFDSGQIVQMPGNSLGSGFIIHPNGYVITNNHVIDRARTVNVELADGRKLPAEVVCADADADLAMLKVESDKPFPAIELGDSSDLLIGEPVIAVGNPLGFSHSVSTGIVSAVHRDLKDAKAGLSDLVQTDAAINPGNSGGPLLNAYGQVIGINTAIRGDAQNIGFAIPVNKMRDMIPELMSPRLVRKVDLAISMTEKRTLALPAKITSNILLEGDRVATINGKTPENLVDAYAMVLSTPLDKEIVVKLKDGKEKKFTAKELPVPEPIVDAKSVLGLGIELVTPAIAEKRQLATEDGLYIKDIDAKGVCAKLGLNPGDVIIQLGRFRTRNLDEFAAALQRMPRTGKVRMVIVRGNRTAAATIDFGDGT